MGNLEEIVEASFLLLTHLPQALKHIVYCVKAKEIRILLRTLQSEEFVPKTSDQINKVKRVLFRKHVDTWLAIVGCSLTVMLWCLRPFLYKTTQREFPLKTWFPVPNVFESPNYEILYLYQVISIFVNALHDCAQETFVTGMIGQACAQMDLLQDNIEKISPNFGEMAKIKSCVMFTKSEIEFKEKFNECIRHHIKIKR